MLFFKSLRQLCDLFQKSGKPNALGVATPGFFVLFCQLKYWQNNVAIKCAHCPSERIFVILLWVEQIVNQLFYTLLGLQDLEALIDGGGQGHISLPGVFLHLPLDESLSSLPGIFLRVADCPSSIDDWIDVQPTVFCSIHFQVEDPPAEDNIDLNPFPVLDPLLFQLDFSHRFSSPMAPSSSSLLVSTNFST